MIVFDLACSSGHVFEAWFASSAAYEEQRSGSLIACPVCSATEVTKAVMAPNVAAKGNSRPEAPPAAAMKAALAAIAQAQAAGIKDSTWVGTAFADKARAMHSGQRTWPRSTDRRPVPRRWPWQRRACRSRRC
jgi:hypothetical protein